MDFFLVFVEIGVNFLVELYYIGVGYSIINIIKCVLLICILIDGCKSFGSYFFVSRFIEGVFELIFIFFKYFEIWDIK